MNSSGMMKTLPQLLATVALTILPSVGSAKMINYAENLFRFGYRMEGSKPISGIFRDEVPDFARLQRDRARFNTYPEFLDYLLTSAPFLKDNFVFVNHSQSLQVATPEHPRVLVFGGGVVYSFAEHPLNRRQRVEMMEMDPVTRELRMRELVFTEQGPVLHENPKACAACHGTRAKPLWYPYDFWPNALGSEIGRSGTQDEVSAYREVRARAAGSPLMSRLNLREEYGAASQALIEPFTHYVGNLNWMRWWKQNRPPEAFKYLLLAQLRGCGSDEKVREFFLGYVHADQREEAARRFDAIYADTRRARPHMTDYLNRMRAKLFPNAQLIPQNFGRERLANEIERVTVIRAALDLMGVNAANLSAGPAANDYFLSSPSNFIVDGLTALYETHPDYFADLQVSTMSGGSESNVWTNLSCEELRSKAVADVSQPAPSAWRPFAERQPERPAINQCIKCHAEGLSKDAPAIPFDDTLALVKRLRDPRDPLAGEILRRIDARDASQMPPGQPLSTEESRAVRAFVEELR